MSKSEVAMILVTLRAAYPRQDISPAMHELWVKHLADCDIGLVQAAVGRHIATSKWWPTIAEIRGESAPRPRDEGLLV